MVTMETYNGSPIPINTTLRILFTLFACTNCSIISPVVKLPMIPMVPVAQNLIKMLPNHTMK